MLANAINNCNLIVSILSVVLTMSCNNVSNSVAQRVIIKFLFNEGVKATEIHQRLHKQFEEECLSLRTVFEWCKSFQDGRERVSNLPHAARPASAVNLGNIQKVDQLIRSNRRISVNEIAGILNMSVGSVYAIVHGKLKFSKVSARWVPKQLSAEQQQKRLQVCGELRLRYEYEGDDFLSRIITTDETWVHHYIPESKNVSVEWRHSSSPPPKKFKRQPSAGKVMATVF